MEREEKIQYLANLIALVRSDGKVLPDEEKLLFTLAKGIGAGFLFLDQAEKLATSTTFNISYPARSSDALRLFEDMLLLAHADGKLAPEETSLVKDLLAHLELPTTLVNRIKVDVAERYKALK